VLLWRLCRAEKVAVGSRQMAEVVVGSIVLEAQKQPVSRVPISGDERAWSGAIDGSDGRWGGCGVGGVKWCACGVTASYSVESCTRFASKDCGGPANEGAWRILWRCRAGQGANVW
jgi:hypothetical protein